MVCRVQVSPQPELEEYTVRLARWLKAVQLDERLRADAARRPRSMSPIVSGSAPRWFNPRLAAAAELVGVAEYLHHMTESM
jgi:hypothetical protein